MRTWQMVKRSRGRWRAKELRLSWLQLSRLRLRRLRRRLGTAVNVKADAHESKEKARDKGDNVFLMA